MKIIALSVLLAISINSAAQNPPKISTGKIDRLEDFASGFVIPRNIDIWIPDGYSDNEKYAVVYMHDGQMLFDSTQTWNKKEWKADEIFAKLIADKKIPPCIVVGIWNTPERITEYFPNKIMDLIEPELGKSMMEKYGNGRTVNADNYLKFIVKELKPYIDSHYSTYDDKEHNFMIGSSMGGLISLYAISEYPDIFGGAACLSTSWFSFTEPNYAIPLASFNFVAQNLPEPNGHRIYMDYGTGESDKNYELTQSFIDLMAKGKGYNDNNYKSAVYENDQHEENAWSRRLHIPILFLFNN